MHLIRGIISTTHLDRHYERMSKECLEDMARQINEKYIPFRWNHQEDLNPGVVLCGKVFKLNDGESALIAVIGWFESEKEKHEYVYGKPNTEYVKYLDEIGDIGEFKDKLCGEKVELPSKISICDLLRIHLDSSKVLKDGSLIKIKRYIATVDDLMIIVQTGDHLPRHFHVKSKQRGIDARFNLNTLELINMKKGQIKSKDIKKIKDFFETNSSMLQKLKDEGDRIYKCTGT
ncbi:DUF4160 domain-containing protein [Candidatus Dojkabacteria bacterium]|nr:DUF4160 domain-containing protein [Candidatus Dojkabacteria bacterium]